MQHTKEQLLSKVQTVRKQLKDMVYMFEQSENLTMSELSQKRIDLLVKDLEASRVINQNGLALYCSAPNDEKVIERYSNALSDLIMQLDDIKQQVDDILTKEANNDEINGLSKFSERLDH